MGVLLTPDQAAFLQGTLSMDVGAVGRDGWPCVWRAQGIVVGRDRRQLEMLGYATALSATLAAVLSTGDLVAPPFVPVIVFDPGPNTGRARAGRTACATMPDWTWWR